MPLFVSSDATPDEPGWLIAHNASDAYDRSIRAGVTEVTNRLRNAEGEPDWKAHEQELQKMLRSRYVKISDKVGIDSQIPGLLFVGADEKDFAKALEKKAREDAKDIVRNSRKAYRKAKTRLARQGITGRQASELLRPLRGLNDQQTTATVNRLLAMREANASRATLRREAKKLGRAKLLSRGRTIARSSGLDAAKLSQALVVQQAIDQGAIQGAVRQWVAALDVTHEECRRMNGQITGMDQPFVDPVTGERFDRAHRHVACRCGEAYRLVTETGEIAAA